MIVHELRNHVFTTLKTLFSSEISANKVEVIFGLNEMPSMNAIRLGNSSDLRSTNFALGHKVGLFKAEVDLLIMIDIMSGFDAMQNEETATAYANKILYALVADADRPESLHNIQDCHSLELEFLTTETDQIGQNMVTTVAMSIIWKGEVDDSDEI